MVIHNASSIMKQYTRMAWNWRGKNVRIPSNVSNAVTQSRASSKHCNVSAQSRVLSNQTSSTNSTSSIPFIGFILGMLGLFSVAEYDSYRWEKDEISASENSKREEMNEQIKMEIEAEVQPLRNDITKEIGAKIQRETVLNQRANEAPTQVARWKAFVRAFFIDY